MDFVSWIYPSSPGYVYTFYTVLYIPYLYIHEILHSQSFEVSIARFFHFSWRSWHGIPFLSSKATNGLADGSKQHHPLSFEPWKPQNDGGNAGERRQVSVIFSPESATEMNHKIVFKARFSVAKQTAQSPHFKALQFKTLPEIWDSCKTDCAWLNNYVRSFLKNSLSKKYLSCCGCHRSNTVAGWNPAGSHRRPLCSWIHIAMHWSRSFPAIKLHLRLKGWENQRLPWVLMLRSQEKNTKNPNTVNPIILDMLHGGFRLQRFWRLGCRYQLPVGYHFTGICLDMHAFLCSSPPLWGSIPYAAPF